MFWLEWRGRRSSASGIRTSKSSLLPVDPELLTLPISAKMISIFAALQSQNFWPLLVQQCADSIFFFFTIFSITSIFTNKKHQKHFTFYILHALFYFLKQKDQKYFLKQNLFIFLNKKVYFTFPCTLLSIQYGCNSNLGFNFICNPYL